MRYSQLALILCLSAPLVAQSASIDVAGYPGYPGWGSADGLPAGDGGPGGLARVSFGEVDPSNAGSATGGPGGTGGSYNPDPYGPPGGGGDGGAAIAYVGSSSGADARAAAVAQGGVGGTGGYGGLVYGGPPYDMYPVYGAGGDGGSADARSTARSSSGLAEATAEARGGVGGWGGSAVPQSAYLVGATGSALADADASSDLGDSSSRAFASGSGAQAFSFSTSSGGNATAFAEATGVTGRASSLERPDSIPAAHAVAAVAGDGIADATAIATGTTSRYSNGAYEGGESSASAQASSDSGAATARATQIAGAAPPILVLGSGYPNQGGGPGVAVYAYDLVHGSTSGLLTLEQTAIASDAVNERSGGAAMSTLNAINPGGGDLRAESSARGGAGGWNCSSRGLTYCYTGDGGSAVATVEATGPYSASIDARAHATGGLGGVNPFTPYGEVPDAGGSAWATAVAAGGHALFAQADATAQLGAPAIAVARAVDAPGGINSAQAGLSVESLTSSYGMPLPGTQQTLVAQSGMGVPMPATAPLPNEVAHQRLFARPDEAAAAAALAGNPNASAVLGDRGVLALASFGAAVSEPGLTLGGYAVLDLAEAYFDADDTIALAFLDPTGSFADAILHLSLARNGQVLFEQSLTGDAPGLDDVVMELGNIVAPGEDFVTYTLEWRLQLSPSVVGPVDVALDFALLGAMPVAESGAAVLLILVGVGLVVARRRG